MTCAASGVDGPQHLVPLDHIPHRGNESRLVQCAVQPNRERHVVDGLAALHPIQEPQPTLRERQRHHLRPLHPNQRAAGRRRPTRSRSPATVGASKRSRMDSSTPSASRTRLIRRSTSSEWPPRSKKSSSTPTFGSAEDLGEDLAEDLLLRRDRRPPRAARDFGSGSAARSSLPLGDNGNSVSDTNTDGTM